MRDYSATIKEASKELTAKERIMMKDTADCVKLDKATQEGAVIINPDFYVIIGVHNEKAEDKDYEQYIVVDKDGTKYSTGSESFFSTFLGIFNELKDESEEWCLKAYRLPSKNRQGKDFITCSVM